MISTRGGLFFSRRAARRSAVSLCILLVSLFAVCDCSGSEVLGELSDESMVTQLLEMAIPVGETRIVPVDDVTRAAVGDPSIVDIVVIGPDLILANVESPWQDVAALLDGFRGGVRYSDVLPGFVRSHRSSCQADRNRLGALDSGRLFGHS